MQMNDGEIYRNFNAMKGTETDRVCILAELNDCSARTIRGILEQEKKRQNAGTPLMVEKKKEDNTLTRENISEWVTSVIFATLDALDVEMKDLERALEAKRREYEKLVKML